MNEMSVPTQRSLRIAFTGTNGAFRRLIIRGLLLEVVSFGFYRFWLATRMRRHLWAHTTIDGDSLEYTGTGRELLIGFLFALAVLVPIYVVYFLIVMEAEHAKPFASLPLGLSFYGFAQFAIYRARRYRLTRTLWRGVRFWMTGSGLAYAAKSFGWALLAGITLGLAYPWRAAALERYKMAHTHYGDLQGRFASNGWAFFKRAWWLWFLTALCFLVAIAAIFLMVGSFMNASKMALSTNSLDTRPVRLAAFLTLVAVFVAFPFLYAAFKACEWRWWLQGLRFSGPQGELSVASDLRTGALVGNYWTMIGAILVTFVAVVLLIGAGRQTVTMLTGVDIFAMGRGHISTFGIAITYYLVLILTIGVIQRIYLVQRIWKLVFSSITLHNLAIADHVTAQGAAANAFGEGLADGLDVAGF